MSELSEEDQEQQRSSKTIMDMLDQVINVISKEVKEENDNCRQVIQTMLSAWAKNPQNLRILSPSGEGKTHLVKKIAKLFPKKNVILLGNASAQSIKYSITGKVIYTEDGEPEDYQSVINRFAGTEQEKKDKIKELEKDTYDLVELSNKILIFIDSQDPRLWESIKPVLSHDQEYIRVHTVNKSKSGTNQLQKIVFHGYPAVIYCSAKDEQTLDRTDEINTRFNTISLNSSQKKYRQMLELAACKGSVPDCIYQEEVISDAELECAREAIIRMISNVQTHSIINPFGDCIQKKFSDDSGAKTRQLNIFLSNIEIHALANSYYRPKFEYKDTVSVICKIDDVIAANKLTKKPSPLPLVKIQFFNNYVRNAIVHAGRETTIGDIQIKGLVASEIVDQIAIRGITTNRKKLQENYLKPYVDYGFLEEFQDPVSKNRFIYSLATKYQTNEASIESTLFDNMDIDRSCVKSFIDRIITRRLKNGRLESTIGMETTPDDLLDEMLNRQDESDSTHENSIVDSSKNVEGEKP